MGSEQDNKILLKEKIRYVVSPSGLIHSLCLCTVLHTIEILIYVDFSDFGTDSSILQGTTR